MNPDSLTELTHLQATLSRLLPLVKTVVGLLDEYANLLVILPTGSTRQRTVCHIALLGTR